MMVIRNQRLSMWTSFDEKLAVMDIGGSITLFAGGTCLSPCCWGSGGSSLYSSTGRPNSSNRCFIKH